MKSPFCLGFAFLLTLMGQSMAQMYVTNFMACPNEPKNWWCLYEDRKYKTEAVCCYLANNQWRVINYAKNQIQLSIMKNGSVERTIKILPDKHRDIDFIPITEDLHLHLDTVFCDWNPSGPCLVAP
ncbi:hypothetical protein PGT21_013313 [Puccinia graminis f. sp. tritici]|uniref:Uncharacterized protein n=1 Tax=Puccinia graminis f. sp. tritici TaxID=56615 RepID=A0A5B0MFE2_PUCGR|nr:hypothetical protein PGT21_013313 [Puccinia graminis f. sp. tritici]